MSNQRPITFGKEQSEKIRTQCSILFEKVQDAVEENLKNRNEHQSYLESDNEIFNPFIDAYVSGIIIHPMESYFLSLGKQIYHDVVKVYENEKSLNINKEHLFFALSILSIRCGDEISAMSFWELAQNENEKTYGGTNHLDNTIDLIISKFTSVLSPIKHVYNDNQLVKKLKPSFSLIDDFQTVLTSLNGLQKAHFLSCGLKQVHVLEKLRTHGNLSIIKIFAQELVNSLCLLNESLLKSKGLSGNMIGPLMVSVHTTYPLVGSYLGLSTNSSGVYGIGKTNFKNNFEKFINFIETSITDENKLKADTLYALHQLRNEALHSIDDTRKYYNDVELFEKTIGLLFICVSVIQKL